MLYSLRQGTLLELNLWNVYKLLWDANYQQCKYYFTLSSNLLGDLIQLNCHHSFRRFIVCVFVRCVVGIWSMFVFPPQVAFQYVQLLGSLSIITITLLLLLLLLLLGSLSKRRIWAKAGNRKWTLRMPGQWSLADFQINRLY